MEPKKLMKDSNYQYHNRVWTHRKSQNQIKGELRNLKKIKIIFLLQTQ